MKKLASIAAGLFLALPLSAGAYDATLDVTALWKTDEVAEPRVTVEVTDTILYGDLPETYPAEIDADPASEAWDGRRAIITLNPFDTYHVRVILSDGEDEIAVRSYDIEPDVGETIRKKVRFKNL